MPMDSPHRLFDRLLAAWHERAIVLKAMSFAVVGVVNSLVDFGVFSFACYYLGAADRAANVMAWLVAVTGSYVMNSFTPSPANPAASCAGAPMSTLRRRRRSPAWSPTPRRSSSRRYFMPVLIGQAARDRRELPGQLLAVALRGVPQAPRRRRALARATAGGSRSRQNLLGLRARCGVTISPAGGMSWIRPASCPIDSGPSSTSPASRAARSLAMRLGAVSAAAPIRARPSAR